MRNSLFATVLVTCAAASILAPKFRVLAFLAAVLATFVWLAIVLRFGRSASHGADSSGVNVGDGGNGAHGTDRDSGDGGSCDGGT